MQALKLLFSSEKNNHYGDDCDVAEMIDMNFLFQLSSSAITM